MSATMEAGAALAEAATVTELHAACKALIAGMGGDAVAHVRVGISRYGNADCAVSIHPEGIAHSSGHYEYGSTWPEAFAKARAWVATHTTVAREATVRRMALAVIDLTDQHGRCTADMLRRREFGTAEIADLHTVACQRAGEMCAGAPFSVEGV